MVEYGGLAIDPLLNLSANRTISISTILPVTGMQLTAVKNIAGILLQWSTFTETNADYFDILHSTDGISYTKIGQLQAAGNSTGVTNYSWQHTSPASGNQFYQIRENDLDGRYQLSNIRQVLSATGGFSLAPNPASGNVIISCPVTGSILTLIIRNSTGAEMIRQNIQSGQTNLDISRLPAGIYLAEIIGKNGSGEKLQFVKQ